MEAGRRLGRGVGGEEVSPALPVRTRFCFRCSVFQWFLIWLSVRPGSSLAMSAHLFCVFPTEAYMGRRACQVDGLPKASGYMAGREIVNLKPPLSVSPTDALRDAPSPAPPFSQMPSHRTPKSPPPHTPIHLHLTYIPRTCSRAVHVRRAGCAPPPQSRARG